MNECIECIATLICSSCDIDSNFIYRAFYYRRETQLTVVPKKCQVEKKKVLTFLDFLQVRPRNRRPRLCFLVHSGRRRTTEYCSELVTLRRRKQKKSMAAEENWSSGKTAKLVLLVLLCSSILVESTPQHSNLVTITAEGKKTI